MYYELYVDSLFLVNFVMNLYVLLIVNRITYRTAAAMRVILGAMAGAVAYLFLFLVSGPGWLKLAVCMIVGNIAMIQTAFRTRNLRVFLNILEKLVLVTFLMGGGVFFLLKHLSFMKEHVSGIFGVMGAGAIICLIINWLGRCKWEGNHLCKVTLLSREGIKVTVTALMDSGNSLVEPISGKPVSVVDDKIFYALWEKPPELFRAIPYHSIGMTKGILRGYLVPEAQIEVEGGVKICRDIYVAVAQERLSVNSEIEMIVNPVLLQKG